jgi:methionine-rich copper-binding protein CopC
MGARMWLAGLVAVLAVLVGGGPAAAHSDLASSDPEDGAVLAQPPTSVAFTFNESLLPQGNAITLTDTASGQRLTVAAADVDGDTVSVPWPQAAPAGQYRAAYRVVSADGHPIAGSITFTVQAGASASPDPSASASAPTATPTPAPSAGAPVATPAATPLASPQPAAAPGSDADANMAVWALGVGVLVLGSVGAATWYARRARRA